MPPVSSQASKAVAVSDCDVHFSHKSFSTEVVHFLNLKGYCLVETGLDKVELSEAALEGKALDDRFYVPPPLVVEALLGTEGSAQIAELEVPTLMEVSERRDGDNLRKVDTFMTNVAVAIDESLEPVLGFCCGERTRGLLHMANKFGGDDPVELTEASAGRWIHIFRRHRLMMIVCLGLKGGSLTLRPFDEVSEPDVVEMKFGQMVVLRADALAHSYSSVSEKDLALTCWLLQPDRSGARGAFANQDLAVVPVAKDLVKWSEERLMLLKQNEATEIGSLHDQDIPRNWKLKAAHTIYKGVQVAVRGVAINQPMKCETMQSLLAPLVHGCDFGIEIPFKRWDHFRDGPNMGGWYNPEPDIWRHNRFRTNIRHASFIEGHDLFDNKFFNLSLIESKVMDPNQRLALESAYEALHMSGYTKKALMQAFIGVYQGHTASDWDKIEHEQAGGCAGSYSPTIASNRVSFSLGLMGPSFTIDVEGASSMAGIYQGAHDIVPSGDWRKPPTTASICGGQVLNLSSYWWPVHNQYMSIMGRCLSFDHDASGYIKGEGISTTVLKRHADVVEGEVVLDESKPNIAILSGWAMINSGANAGLSAPSGPALQRVVADSVRIARISPLDVDAVECHGVGNFIHDATEASCVAKALRGLPAGDEEVLTLTSAKSKLGFLQETAGIASFFSTIVSQKIGCCTPNIHLKAINAYIDFEELAVNINTEITCNRLRSSFVGVNAYGFGGTNVNTLLFTEIDEERFPTPEVDLDRQAFAFWPGGGGELEDELQPAKGYSIIGSWSQWEVPERMKDLGNGSYGYTMTLGPNRFEHFQIWIDGSSEKALHPGEPCAPTATTPLGPAPFEECQGSHWLIDGNTQLVALPSAPAGPEFTSHSGYITVGGDLLEQSMTLEEAKQMCASLAQCKGFCYEGTPTPEGKVNVVFKNKWDLAGKAGWTSYRLEEQPASDVASLEYYSVGGRDVGRPGDLYEVRLQIKGKWKAVVWDRIGSSDSGVADAGTYYLVASWQDWEPVPMEKSASTAGLYTLDVTLVGGRFDRHVRGAFQVVRNKDPYQTFVPGSGKAAVGREGTLGAGIYFAETAEACAKKAQIYGSKKAYALVAASVDLGRCRVVKHGELEWRMVRDCGFKQSDLEELGFSSVGTNFHGGWEYCVFDPARVAVLDVTFHGGGGGSEASEEDSSGSAPEAAAALRDVPEALVRAAGSSSWTPYRPNPRVVAVIAPGAGMRKHAYLYKELGRQGYDVVPIFDDSYDHYPPGTEVLGSIGITGLRMPDMRFNRTKNLATFVDDVVLPKIRDLIAEGRGPAVVIAASRGGIVSVPRLWEAGWRGPSVVGNGGFVSTAAVPASAPCVLVTAGWDSFTTRRPETTASLLRKEDPSTPVLLYHDPREDHDLNCLTGKVLGRLVELAATGNLDATAPGPWPQGAGLRLL